MTWRPSCASFIPRLQSGRTQFEITRNTSTNLYSVEIMLAALRGATSFAARRAGRRNLAAGLPEGTAVTCTPRVGLSSPNLELCSQRGVVTVFLCSRVQAWAGTMPMKVQDEVCKQPERRHGVAQGSGGAGQRRRPAQWVMARGAGAITCAVACAQHHMRTMTEPQPQTILYTHAALSLVSPQGQPLTEYQPPFRMPPGGEPHLCCMLHSYGVPNSDCGGQCSATGQVSRAWRA